MDISNIITSILLIVLAGLTLGFVFYRKIIHVSIFFIKVIFPVSLVLALSTIFFPQIYQGIVEQNFQESPLTKNLQSVDKTLTQVSKVQINITNSINNFFNTGNKETVEEYKSDIYSQVTIFFAGLIRLTVLLLSLIVLIVSLYLRYAFSGNFEMIELQRQINQLKKEIKEIKKTDVVAIS